MSKKENAPSIGGTMEEAVEEIIALVADTSSVGNSTTAGGNNAILSGILGYGEENAVKGEDICSVLGIDRRKMYALIRSERKHGVLILASNEGYFLPDNTDPDKARREIKIFLRTFTARAIDTLTTAKPFRLKLKHIEGQFRIAEVEHGK